MITYKMDGVEFNQRFNARIAQSKKPTALLKVAGREVGNQLKKHFRMKDRTEPNHLSERRSHFWLAVSRTVSNPFLMSPTSIGVTVAHPAFAQKVFGGVIRAKRVRNLSIPVEEQAYGRTPATFERETGLKLFFLTTGKGAFVNAVLAIHVAGGGLQVEYLLTPSVNQKPDPTALPPKAQLEQAILDRADKTLQRQLEDQKGDEA